MYTIYHCRSSELSNFSEFLSSAVKWHEGRTLGPMRCKVCARLHRAWLLTSACLSRDLYALYFVCFPLKFALKMRWLKRAWRSLRLLPRPRSQKERAAHTRRSKNCDSCSQSSCVYVCIFLVFFLEQRTSSVELWQLIPLWRLFHLCVICTDFQTEGSATFFSLTWRAVSMLCTQRSQERHVKYFLSFCHSASAHQPDHNGHYQGESTPSLKSLSELLDENSLIDVHVQHLQPTADERAAASIHHKLLSPWDLDLHPLCSHFTVKPPPWYHNQHYLR